VDPVTGGRTAIVAGGGIGGLAAATALARRGLSVTVVERARRIDDAGSGLMLYQNGVAAADRLSPRLGARIRAVGHVTGPDEVRLLLDARGKVLSREPIGAVGRRLGLPQVPILRAELRAALYDEALAAGARVMLDTAVTGYASHGDRASVRLSDARTLHGDVLVAADGIRSVIRARMLHDGPPRYRGYTSVRGRTLGSELYPQAFVASGRGVQLFVAPVGGGTLYWTAKITAPSGVWPAMGSAGALSALASLLEQWHPPVLRLILDAKAADVVVTDICDREPVRTWVDGRVALLGDAAHPMVPAMGQGANTALEDAVVLAQAMRPDADPGQALRCYERQRVDRTAEVVLRSRRQGDVDQGAGEVTRALRDLAMRLRGRKDAAAMNVIGWRPDAAE
jgi:2-polyprenyl-6-methoxyphenol hydroxylase-like FAD-dependent oxidoreductase